MSKNLREGCQQGKMKECMKSEQRLSQLEAKHQECSDL